MDKPITIRQMKLGEEERVCDLIRRIFNEFVASYYPQEGIEEFLGYINPILMAERVQSNHLILLAESGSELLGMIEVRNWNHISLLVVDSQFHQRGIARQLLRKVLEISKRECPDLTTVTVNSSPNAIEAYERLGFHVEGSEQIRQGIRFVRMKMCLDNGMR